MAHRNILQVFEFDKLYYDEVSLFRQRHWEALCRYLENAGRDSGNRFTPFRILHKGIQFLQYVGVIQAGNLTIEVLPKTDRQPADPPQTTPGSKLQWHRALLQMLSECKLLPVHPSGNAWLQRKDHSILDVYLELFLTEATHLVQEGLHKQYKAQESNKMALKGRLSVSKQIRQNSLHRERFYVCHAVYDTANPFNSILYQTLQLIHSLPVPPAVQEKTQQLLARFPPLAPAGIQAATFERLVYNRKTERYRQAMQLAGMLLLNYRPDITGGTENLVAILFDMNLLWEEWVYRRLKREEARYPVKVLRQQSTRFWKGEHLPRHKTIRPDLVLQTPRRTIVIDTKWKITEDRVPGDADLKQMFVYNLYWQSEQSFLLYPAAESSAHPGSYVDLPQLNGHASRCSILTQSIFREGKPDADFGRHLLEQVLTPEERAETIQNAL